MKQLESVSPLLKSAGGKLFVQEFYRDDQTDKIYKKYVEFDTMSQYLIYLKVKGISR